MASLEQRIEAANAEGRVARIPFITAGFPSMQGFVDILRDLDANGADIIEVGIPFSDPVADGPVVEDASRRALEQGVTLEWIINLLKSLSPRLQAGLVLMGYYNPFLQYGLERLACDAVAAGVQGFIVPDLPLDEDSSMRTALSSQGLDLIALVGLNTDEERMKAYNAKSTGYAYLVSVMGITGGRNSMGNEVAVALERAERIFSLPVALGFGINSPEQIEAMQVKPHAAVFGSALLRHLDAGGTAGEFMAPWLKSVK